MFWAGFGEGSGPSFEGLSVLEIGCGGGWRCVDVAAKGAKRVLGIDPYSILIERAKESLANDHTDFSRIIEYRCCRISDVSDERFNIIISENAFEHIMDVGDVLSEIRRKLRVGGRAYIGFGPLYHSPFGDHGWVRAALPLGHWLPWGHLMLPERLLLKVLSRHYGRNVPNMYDWHFLSLNKLTVAEFRALFRDSGLWVRYLRTNVAYSLIGRLFGLFGRIRFIEKYFTHNLFCILENNPPPT
ncbi:MAG: class I SAM-dependent methyltransferase [Planctomycetaceae bacterium]|nr:class I SAM-dependent methyltransferase [Planctomycetaceae bacterium]